MIVCPISGCRTSSERKSRSINSASSSAGMSCLLTLSAKSQADSTTKPGLTNSEGCRNTPPPISQRVAPLRSIALQERGGHQEDAAAEQKKSKAA